MKFKNYKDIVTDQHGFQFVKNNIIVTDKIQKCFICGTPTKYIEVCSEAYFCSDACVKRFYDRVADMENMLDNDF